MQPSSTKDTVQGGSEREGEVDTELNLCGLSLHSISTTSRGKHRETLAEEDTEEVGKVHDEEVEEKHIHESL